MTQSVLFVCLGNICRSPAGEGIMQHLVNSQGFDSQIIVDSAGTLGLHSGNLADRRMREHAARRGYNLLSRSRELLARDLDEFDLVIAMDSVNLRDIRSLDPNPAASVRLLSDFLNKHWPIDVPDPYYGGVDGFELVLDMIEEACPKILESLTSDI